MRADISGHTTQTPPVRPPRTIVVVVADDFGYGDASCFNPASTVPTPALDRLASDGLRFTHARTPSALCTPSRYALLTGRAHWRTGAPRALVDPYGPPLLEPSTPTTASVLRSVGYRTAFVGKWHLGFRYPAKGGGWTQEEPNVDFGGRLDGGPLQAGFDTFFGTAGCCTSDPPYAFISGDRFPVMPTATTPPSLAVLPGVEPGLMVPDWDVRTVDDTLVDDAVARLGEHAADTTGPPLLLYLALSAPHNPWEPPERFVGVSGDGERGDMAAAFDGAVDRVLDAIDGLGLADDTLLMVTSDHGPQYEQGHAGHRPTGPLRGRKNTVWEGGLRVPTWLRWPGRVAAGTVSAAPMLHTDLIPTLAHITGAELPAGAAEDGASQLGAWLGGASERRRPTLFECGGRGQRFGAWAVLDDDWKLHVVCDDHGHQGTPRLYDLASDPGERTDRASERPEVVERLFAVLRGALTDVQAQAR